MIDPTTPATAATGPEPAAPAAAPEVDYANLLDSVPEDVLLRHRRVNGLVGSHARRQAEQMTANQQAEAQAKAIRDQEQAMMALAESNPFEFTQKWLGDKAQEVAKREFSELEARTQHDILDKLGAAYGSVPEWKELTQEEFGDIAARTAGLSGADLIAAFNTGALEKVADKRARKQTESAVQIRLKQEREAWERESAAARLRGESVPDMSRSQGGARFDPSQLSDSEFKEWYERNMLR